MRQLKNTSDFVKVSAFPMTGTRFTLYWSRFKNSRSICRNPWPYGGIKYKQQCTRVSTMFFRLRPNIKKNYYHMSFGLTTINIFQRASLNNVSIPDSPSKYAANWSSTYLTHAFQLPLPSNPSPNPGVSTTVKRSCEL